MECDEEFGFQYYLSYHLQMHKKNSLVSVDNTTFEDNLECDEEKMFNPTKPLEVATGSKMCNKGFSGENFFFLKTKLCQNF